MSVCVRVCAPIATILRTLSVCVCACSPQYKTKENRAERICTIIPRQAAALCLCAQLPVGLHIITAAILIHHSIVVVYAGPILSLAQQRYIKKQ